MALRRTERPMAMAIELALMVWLCLVALPARAQPPGAQSYAFRGRVVSVDLAAGNVTVAHERVDGLMGAMTMTFRPDRPDVLKTLKPGDTVTATIYDGDLNSLYNFKVVATAAAAVDDLPPISYVCPTAAEATYLDDKPGKCPVSGEALVAVRLVTAYSCLKNQLFIYEAPGRCPTDRSELVPVTVAMHFTCKSDPGVREISPGTCADGSVRIKAFERRPHGDHNPRHGGDFVFMAVDQWHHLEGTFVAPGVFRLYLYDDMKRPLAASSLAGRVTLADTNAREVGPSIPLVLGASDRSTMEANISGVSFPFSMKLFMKFRPNDREQVFDFTFRDYSKEP